MTLSLSLVCTTRSLLLQSLLGCGVWIGGSGGVSANPLRIVTEDLPNHEKLTFARIDLWINDQYSASYLTRHAGDDPAQVLVQSRPLKELGDEFSLGTPTATVERFRQGPETIHRNGTYDAIARKWL